MHRPRRRILQVVLSLIMIYLTAQLLNSMSKRALEIKHKMELTAKEERRDQELQNTMRRHARDGVLFISSLDIQYLPLALNLFYTSYRKFNLTNHLFVSSDDEACEPLVEIGANCVQFFQFSDLILPPLFNSKEYNQRTYLKPIILEKGLKADLNVVIVDLDVVFLQNPLPYLTCKCYDIIYQHENKVDLMNSGFFMIRPTKAGKTLVGEVVRAISSENDIDGDQVFFNRVLSNMRTDKEIEEQALDGWMFPNGMRVYEVNHQMFAEDFTCNGGCVAFHNNFIVSLQAKIYRFKELGLWEVNSDSYYTNVKQKYIQYDNPLDFGLETITMELKALKTAFILGHILNRVVILPKFHCNGVVNYFEPRPGELCYFAAFYSVRALDAFTDNYREHVFLNNPKVPDAVKTSKSDIYLINSALWQGNRTKPSGTVLLQPGEDEVTSDDIKRWFLKEQAHVLRFHSLYNDIDDLDAETDIYRFRLAAALQRTDFRQFE